MDSNTPAAGGGFVIRPTTDGGYEAIRQPLHQPGERPMSADEAMAFAAYDGLSRLELMRRLRRAEWDADLHKKRADALARELREIPPLYRIQELAARLKQVRALAERPGRSIPKTDLLNALDTPAEEPQRPDAA